MAVHSGRTKSQWLAAVAELYSLIQIGIQVNYEALENIEALALIELAKEMQIKQERNAKMEAMKNRRR